MKWLFYGIYFWLFETNSQRCYDVLLSVMLKYLKRSFLKRLPFVLTLFQDFCSGDQYQLVDPKKTSYFFVSVSILFSIFFLIDQNRFFSINNQSIPRLKIKKNFNPIFRFSSFFLIDSWVELKWFLFNGVSFKRKKNFRNVAGLLSELTQVYSFI